MLARNKIISSTEFQSGKISEYEKLFILSFSLSFRDKSKAKLLNLNLPSDYAESQKLLQGFSDDNSRNLIDELKKVNTKSLIIRGNYNHSIYKAALVLSKTLSAELIEMNSGHFPFAENPVEFQEIIIDFINNQL